MSELVFPNDFLWGTATAAHQVEGDNSNCDWWEWELRPGTPCAEPSGAAIDHYHRYPDDIALLAGLGFNTYRFSVEWARIEPEEGVFDKAQLDHYLAMVDSVLGNGMTPMVTLNHFTIPLWLARQGGWTSPDAPRLFERYCRRVVEALGNRVPWYCTVNEPGVVASGGYLAAIGFPPGTGGMTGWQEAIDGLVEGHRRARAAVKEMRPAARVGATHALQEWQSNRAGRPIVEFSRRMNEDVFLEACAEDDFIGVQTYSRAAFNLTALQGAAVRLGLAIPPIRRVALPYVLTHQVHRGELESRTASVRRTQMGWEFRPQAVACTVRRVAKMYPDKDIVVTENGIATADDAERIEYVMGALTTLHEAMAEGVRLRGYIYWSSFDNFEWAYGYAPQFGLVGVDRTTQTRTVKPSGRWLGQVARTGRLLPPDEMATALSPKRPTRAVAKAAGAGLAEGSPPAEGAAPAAEAAPKRRRAKAGKESGAS